ncbi:MAG: putative lipid II flippase FtsW [Candidatus Moranbacteria bacterium]|nr:putative lipid II flippase FtsW [Candidatus Moranbacteria bacterium]
MTRRNADKPLMITTFCLLLFGMLVIFSAGFVLSMNNYGQPYYFFFHQLYFGVIPGLIVWFIAQNINYKIWERIAFPLFLLVLGLLMAVFIPGLGENYQGSTRWLNLGPINVQPTEIAKLAVILYLSAWLSKREQKIKDFTEGFLPFFAVILVMAVLIIKQPDIGTLGIIVIISVTIFFLAQGRLAHLLLLIMIGLLSLYLLIVFAPYRMARFTVFLNPETDPRGIGYQINQALIAIGSGGFWGNGLGLGRQKFLYLPEPIGDSIFAIICEELGMIGGFLVVLLFLIIAWRGYLITKRAQDTFARLVAGGITTWFVFQAFINIAAITSLIPLTGIPLPFISYGASALIVSLVGTGILLNISKQS